MRATVVALMVPFLLIYLVGLTAAAPDPRCPAVGRILAASAAASATASADRGQLLLLQDVSKQQLQDPSNVATATPAYVGHSGAKTGASASAGPAAAATAGHTVAFDNVLGHGSFSAQLGDGTEFWSRSTIQMMFKREVSCKDVVIGTEWENPIRVRNVTGAEAKLAARLTALTKNTILKGYTFDLSADKPYIHSRLMAKADVVSISAGACPDGPIDTATVLEDTSLMGLKGLTQLQRAEYFSNAENAAQHTFMPGMCYTFVVIEKDLSLRKVYDRVGSNRLINLLHWLKYQPLQSMVKDVGTGDYAYAFDFWSAPLMEKFQTNYCTTN